MERPLITARDLERAPGAPLPPGALLTPLARDVLRKRGVHVEALGLGAPPAAAARLVVANWKSHKTLDEGLAFVRDLAALPGAGPQAVLCPPFTLLHPLRMALQAAGLTVELGAQDVSPHPDGPHTGEVSGRQLHDAGCRFAVVGHSERRAAGETSALCRRKALAALAAGLQPIVCVGETLDERRAGRAEAVVSEQLGAVLDALDPARLARLVVAYEPRWAIGTGVTPRPAEVAAMLAHVRRVLARASEAIAAAVPVLYGGSVAEDNAAALLHLPGCSGALVGGASLDARRFAAIRAAAGAPRA